MWNLKKKNCLSYLQSRGRLTENKLMVTSREGGGER